MAPKSVVGPLFSDDIEHQEPDDQNTATDTEEDESSHYESERHFPFPAERAMQEDVRWASASTGIQRTGLVLSGGFRKKNVISWRETTVRKTVKFSHFPVNEFAGSFKRIQSSGKQGRFIATCSPQKGCEQPLWIIHDPSIRKN